MYTPESVLENDTHKYLCDFEIQTDYQIPARKTDLELINKKKTRYQVDFAFPVKHRVKINLDLAREQKKTLLNIRVTVIPV